MQHSGVKLINLFVFLRFHNYQYSCLHLIFVNFGLNCGKIKSKNLTEADIKMDFLM